MIEPTPDEIEQVGTEEADSVLDRRGFLGLTGKAALAAALAQAVDPLRILYAQPDSGEKVSMVFFPNFAPRRPDKAVIKSKLLDALAPIKGLDWLKRGESVAINVASNSAKPYPMTTHPVALEAFVELLLERGASRVVVADLAGMENVAPPFVNDRVARAVRKLWGFIQTGVKTGMEVLEKNGIAAAARRGGARVASFDRESDWVHVSKAGLGWTPDKAPSWGKRPWYKTLAFQLSQGGFRVAKLTREVDHLVNFARPSGHVMAGHTGTIKNWYGWLHPLDRVWSHTRMGFRSRRHTHLLKAELFEVKQLPERIAEVALAFKPKTRLSLVAGIDTYCDVGPDWGTQPLKQSWVFASTGQVAIDAAMAAAVAHEKRRVPKEERAKRYEHQDHGAIPLVDDEVFWGKMEGRMHRDHRTYVIDEMTEDPHPEGIWKAKQLDHAHKIGLGPKKVEYVVGGQPDAQYARAIRHLTGGKSQRASGTRGIEGRLDDTHEGK